MYPDQTVTAGPDTRSEYTHVETGPVNRLCPGRNSVTLQDCKCGRAHCHDLFRKAASCSSSGALLAVNEAARYLPSVFEVERPAIRRGALACSAAG